eukprot:721572-Rhodomonas_salina.2
MAITVCASAESGGVTSHRHTLNRRLCPHRLICARLPSACVATSRSPLTTQTPNQKLTWLTLAFRDLRGPDRERSGANGAFRAEKRARRALETPERTRLTAPLGPRPTTAKFSECVRVFPRCSESRNSAGSPQKSTDKCETTRQRWRMSGAIERQWLSMSGCFAVVFQEHATRSSSAEYSAHVFDGR